MEQKNQCLQGQGPNCVKEACGWLDLNIHTYIKIAIIAVLFVWLFYNEIDNLLKQWLDDPTWSHGLLIPLFSLYFLHHRRKEIVSLEAKPNYFGLFFIIFGISAYILNLSAPSLRVGYIRPLLMIEVLAAIVLFIGGWRLFKYTWLSIVFLIFAIPLPQGYYVRFTMPMRHLAAAVSAALLNLVNGLQAINNGVIIDIIYKGKPIEPSLDVAEACSGMRLMMAFIALGVAMAYLHYRPLWQRLILLLSTVPIAIFCNVARVTVTGFIYVFIGPEYAQNIYHDLLGIAMLPLAFVLYSLLASLLAGLFVEETQPVTEDVIIRKRH